MSRVIAAILLIIVLVVGGGIVATTAYNAGVTAGTTVTTTTAGGATTVTPVVVAPYAYGWHGFGWGWGIFGFFFFLFFLFIVFALLRAIFWGGRGRWGRGWGPGYGGGWYGDKGPNGHGHGGWESRAHETFDDWHQRAHGGPGRPRRSSPAPDRRSRPRRRARPAWPERPEPLPHSPRPRTYASGGASGSTMSADADHPRRRR